MSAGALDGIKVFEFANYVSGPYAGMLLSDLGAEVVKVESPDGGDPFRMWGKTDYNGTFGSMNDASQFVEVIEKRTGYKIGCVEEVAFQEGFITAEQLRELAEPLKKSGYGKYLISLLEQ